LEFEYAVHCTPSELPPSTAGRVEIEPIKAIAAGKDLFVVCLSIKRNVFRQFAALSFYFLSLAVVTAWRFYVFEKYGSGSHEYLYFYYYGETVLTLTLYGAVSNLAQKFLAPFLGRRVSRFLL
jgi:hypothetical protein